MTRRVLPLQPRQSCRSVGWTRAFLVLMLLLTRMKTCSWPSVLFGTATTTKTMKQMPAWKNHSLWHCDDEGRFVRPASSLGTDPLVALFGCQDRLVSFRFVSFRVVSFCSSEAGLVPLVGTVVALPLNCQTPPSSSSCCLFVSVVVSPLVRVVNDV